MVVFSKGVCLTQFRNQLDYVNADGNISNYYPDFLVKLSDKKTVIVETRAWKTWMSH